MSRASSPVSTGEREDADVGPDVPDYVSWLHESFGELEQIIGGFSKVPAPVAERRVW
jgi:hypothetical protein